MKIYVLLRCNCDSYDENETVCVSENINTIRLSAYEDFDIAEDCPKLEIWRDGENVYSTSGDDVFDVILKEINNRRE